ALQQLADDKVGGVVQARSRERAFALGPVLAYAGPGLAAALTYQREFGVRNRFAGAQTTLQLIHHF
ncbi:MAG: transporter, partial [Elusimicrobia bacterium]|nr:transporter [Elusimicrobiota bacterium]